jgi:hypothetical protein
MDVQTEKKKNNWRTSTEAALVPLDRPRLLLLENLHLQKKKKTVKIGDALKNIANKIWTEIVKS